VAHTILSFVAMLAGGCALYTSLRPLLGRERYQQLAHTPLIVVLLLTGVALRGARVYLWWPDRRAFFAWVLPSIWVCHLALSRGIAAVDGKWADPFFFFGVGASYSVGAWIAAMAIKKQEPLSNS
jgi:CDP-diglyceride synthetase